MLVPSFAYYLDPDYSRAAFDEKELDYGSHKHAAELWGRPEHVVRTIEAHNAAARRLVAEVPHALWVDLEAKIADGAENFDDVAI